MQIDLTDPDDFTLEAVRKLIAEGDDTTNSQMRITEDGFAFLSDDVGTQNIAGIRARWETFIAGNGYVGPEAAEDEKWVAEVFRRLKTDWESGRKGYLDYH